MGYLVAIVESARIENSVDTWHTFLQSECDLAKNGRPINRTTLVRFATSSILIGIEVHSMFMFIFISVIPIVIRTVSECTQCLANVEVRAINQDQLSVDIGRLDVSL